MAGPFGVGPGTPGNYGLRAAPGVIQQRPMPVPVTGPVAQPGVIGAGRPMPSTGFTPMPSRVTGLTMPARTGGVTVQQPSVLVPGGTPSITTPNIARPIPSVPGVGVPTIPNRTGPAVARPMPTVPGTTPGVTFPSRTGGYTPTQPGVLVPGGQPTQPTVPGTIGGTRPIPTQPFPTQPGTGQFPSRTTPGTQQPGCGMFSNYGLIGFFDKTVGAVVKRLMGIRDVCSTGAMPLGATTGVPTIGGTNMPFGTPSGGTAQPLSMGMTPLQPRVYR